MNKKTWERTPEDLKVIIEEVALKAYKLHNMFDEQWYDQSMKAFGEKLQIVELKPEEKARWEKKFQEVMINWAADLEKKGLPAKKTLTDFRNVVSKQGVATEVLPSE